MAKPDPESAIFRPMVFDSDYAKIGKAALANQEPTPMLFDSPPDPAIVGEQAYVYERDRLERLQRQAQGGNISAEPWNRIDAALPPGVEEAQLERGEQLRALQGGLPTAPDVAQATEAGNRIQARFTY